MIYDSTGLLNNTFRQQMLRREQLIGCRSSLASPITTEILGLAGFDWLLLDSEHAPTMC
jgi:2-dehydro-3-deoxyglucarate aldolase